MIVIEMCDIIVILFYFSTQTMQGGCKDSHQWKRLWKCMRKYQWRRTMPVRKVLHCGKGDHSSHRRNQKYPRDSIKYLKYGMTSYIYCNWWTNNYQMFISTGLDLNSVYKNFVRICSSSRILTNENALPWLIIIVAVVQ